MTDNETLVLALLEAAGGEPPETRTALLQQVVDLCCQEGNYSCYSEMVHAGLTEAGNSLLQECCENGVTLVKRHSQAVVERLLQSPIAALQAQHFFNHQELASVANELALTLARAWIYGAANLRQRLEDPTEEIIPDAASIKVVMEQHTGQTTGFNVTELEAKALQLASDMDQVLLRRLQNAVRGTLSGDDSLDTDEVLEWLGVALDNPYYSDAVFHTNWLDAYHAGLHRELQAPQLLAEYPVWRYSNPDDDASRPHHAGKNGKYYPATVPFEDVRGTDSGDVINCRCLQVPVPRHDWEVLQAHGAKLEKI